MSSIVSIAATKLAVDGQQVRELAYERGRREIIAAAKIDEVVEIKDKAEKMRAYGIQRKDPALEAAGSAIAFRAHYQIGLESKRLETHERARTDLRPTGGSQTKRAALKAAGISQASAQRDEALTEILTEEQVEKLCQDAVAEGKPAPSAVAIYKQDRDDKLKAKFEAIKNDLPPDLHVGDFRELSPKVIADESVDLVFTDPPYDDESIPLYEAAAQEAARILKPGGSLISYCGHRQLPTVLPLMAKHLKYYWIGTHVHDGGPMSRMTQFGIIVGFKPLLWFVKDYRADRQAFIGDTVLVRREKDTHPWQQAVATAEHFIDGLTSQQGTVVDFFAGGGTTIIAAKNLGRRWMAFEINEKAAVGIMQRVTV